MAPRRFLKGISEVSSANPMGQVDILDPRKWSTYFQDFTGPLLAAATVNNGTVVEAGISIVASANATASVTTDAGALDGCLKFVTTSADNEHCLLQTPSGGFVMTAGKKLFMEAKFEVTHTAGNIEQNELFIGLASFQATTNFFATDGTARTFDDGIGWYSPDATTSIALITGENDVFDSVTAIGTYATATWYTCSMYFDGTDIYTWVNGVSGSKLTPAAIPISVVGPTIYLKSGEAKVHQLLVDYLLVAKERS